MPYRPLKKLEKLLKWAGKRLEKNPKEEPDKLDKNLKISTNSIYFYQFVKNLQLGFLSEFTCILMKIETIYFL